MISRIRGTLTQITESYALVENAGVSYEIMVPSALAERLKDGDRIGQEITFETIYYIEAGDRKSSHFPRIVGFTDPLEREFFSLFTQVPGMGVKKALKSLTIPIRDIAGAIETKNPGTLNRLPGVGGRLADKIIAELNGKTTKFALMRTDEALAKAGKEKRPAFAEDAMEVLLQLQYSRPESEAMISRALQSGTKVDSAEELIALIFKNEQMQKVAG